MGMVEDRTKGQRQKARSPKILENRPLRVLWSSPSDCGGMGSRESGCNGSVGGAFGISDGPEVVSDSVGLSRTAPGDG